jgi:transposase
MADVLYVYKEVSLLKNKTDNEDSMIAILSYDEKPGIQAIENTAKDLSPVPGQHACVGRDYEYKRHGTVSILAGIDLLSGAVHGIVEERHRSLEFIKFLQLADKSYPLQYKIKLILDNHSTHISQETRDYLKTKPNRFDFVFTPTHGSWLNIVESFFAKLTKTMLRAIRVSSKGELKVRIEQHFRELNQDPVAFKWKYGINFA